MLGGRHEYYRKEIGARCEEKRIYKYQRGVEDLYNFQLA